MLRVRAALTGWEGGPGLSTFYYHVPTENDAAAARVRTYVQDLFGNGFGMLMPTRVTWTVLPEVDALASSSGALIGTYVDSDAKTSISSGGAAMEAPATGALLHYTTNVFYSGRRVRGRTFCVPIASACVNNDGHLDETLRLARNAALESVIGGWAAGDYQVVWHRPKLGAGGAEATVQALAFASKLAVLTSRRD